MIPAVPARTANVNIHKNRRSKTIATYFQSSFTYTRNTKKKREKRENGIRRTSLQICFAINFSCFAHSFGRFFFRKNVLCSNCEIWLYICGWAMGLSYSFKVNFTVWMKICQCFLCVCDCTCLCWVFQKLCVFGNKSYAKATAMYFGWTMRMRECRVVDNWTLNTTGCIINIRYIR